MSVSYGFYNSMNGDRKYDATQMSSIFDGIINDGIYETIGDRFVVRTSGGMNVVVGTGRAWFNHTWTLNDSLLPLIVDAAEVINNRIDTVVIEVNTVSRRNEIKVLKGTPDSNPKPPQLVKTGGVYQYPLADINIKAGAVSITEKELTNRVGTSDCPFVIGVLKTMSIDTFVAAWGIQWDDWLKTKNQSYSSWQADSQARFESWFQTITNTLNSNQAGQLANQLIEVNKKLDKIINGEPFEDTITDSNGQNILDSSGGKLLSTKYIVKTI